MNRSKFNTCLKHVFRFKFQYVVCILFSSEIQVGEANIKYKWFIYYLETNQFKSTVNSAKQKTVSTNKYRHKSNKYLWFF